jgi:hypothetical protein
LLGEQAKTREKFLTPFLLKDRIHVNTQCRFCLDLFVSNSSLFAVDSEWPPN